MKIPVLNIKQFQSSKEVHQVYVNSFANHIKINKHLTSTPHSHNFYLCVIFTKGSGVHEIDFKSYSISPGKVFFLKPGQTHFWKFKTPPNGFIFFHSKEFYEMYYLTHQLSNFPFYYSYQNPPVLELTDSLKGIENKFRELLQEYHETQAFRNLKMVNSINDIYIILTRAYTSTLNLADYASVNYLKILEQLEQYIEEYYHQEKLPKYYAGLLNITTKHLNRVTKETLNKTTHQLIAERVILEAKRLIVHSQNPLARIAETLGFEDYAYFSRYFKKKTGTSPIDFKKSYHKK
ncbi:AraC family transcriptional regulator [Mesonia mobilis]|uniref:AraC family transcriptional regulator n=1 Tax=Mesonia mobilis TaxID=369791 RepID=A0ABQ3BSV2_9FLAO|nr:helix-turn-helix transcriptional regulator [Mesonia mobilis]MBQ0737009.1 helix-turn-helix domain-containing protein [Aquimarina celericrescens]GGZ56567.1 AraC family transcriptional regulator [Mesonia mobilis]